MGDSFTANMSNWEVIEPTFTQIVKDFLDGSEGPVFDRDGKFFMVAPIVKEGENFSGQVLTIDLESGKPTVVCSPKDGDIGGIPAGCQCDLDNNIWIADMRLGILKMEQNGKYQQMFKTDRDGKPVQGCNDCIFDYDGNLWVTAPAGNIAPAEFSRSWDEPFGAVYCVTKDKQELVRIDDGYLFSNGLAVLHTKEGKPSKLIVAETRTQSLWGYEILGPGKVGEKSLFGKLPSDYESCGPDGMDFDEDNFLLVTNHGGEHIEVFSPEGGDPVFRIKCPFKTPSNVHFKPGTNEVYVTEHDTHALWKFEWKRKGKPQYCETK